MNGYEGPTAGGLIARFLLLAIFAAIALTFVVKIIESYWPWLVGIGLASVALTVAIARYRRRDSQW